MKINEVYNMDCLDGMRNLPKGHKYCIVTDPPFNVGYHYNEYDDNKEDGEYFAWLQDICANLPVVMVHYPEALYKFAFQIGQFPNRVVAWVYNSNTPRQHRDIAFFGVRPDFSKYLQPYKNPNDKRIAKRIADGYTGGALYDWWEINQIKNVSKKAKGQIHPCQMPVDVMRRIIAVLPDDFVIVDPFLGSGTTAVACIQEKRNFIGFELNADYFKEAQNRIKAEQKQLTFEF